MQIFLHLNGQQEGPYTLEQLQAWLQSGQLPPETLAWYDSLPNWVSVNELVASALQATEVGVTEDSDVAGEAFLHVEHQPEYSRGQLILRMLLGWLYIGLPHGICLFVFFATISSVFKRFSATLCFRDKNFTPVFFNNFFLVELSDAKITFICSSIKPQYKLCNRWGNKKNP